MLTPYFVVYSLSQWIYLTGAVCKHDEELCLSN